ncbi:sugar O-acetyltransferase [Candidatus Cetobacterium colombiensis]|uniref:Acetyltransferase n=1 Tax=Candidatus Cetobacterium colombiensis TaxID=3073100 RepID=A0ABU4WBY1_9FUSO|nr:sugar O-acetyltransferase [Candidatus Cetobacterium colombiensis]MDX8337046.1 sugar O-acetyltransferase [Candidatus Cetobacterium colombiensis]
MTEKEKCNAGQLYNVNYDAELLKERTNCKDLCFKFNQILPSNEEEQTKIMKKIIGKTGNSFVITAPNCCFSTAGHPIDFIQRNEGLEFAYPIKVGNNVWIGAGVTVLPGVTIGDNVIIGAGSVVTRDIPAGVIAVGNPCRILRKITNEDL